MPFLTYGVSPEQALMNAARLLQEGGASAVKLKGGLGVANTVRRLTSAGLPVMGHLGLTPQHVHRSGGMRQQTRDENAASELSVEPGNHPAVREAVFGIPDPQWGELVAACVVLKPDTHITADDLIRHCRASLANNKVPRHVEFLETDLPKSGSGKVLKQILRERFWAESARFVS